ncbi:hypothetical protein BGX28_006341 [Mortierella sp. GBA30]|nr:hypothetical protein BGX28_006341 [Mortierella sp. GBA30]
MKLDTVANSYGRPQGLGGVVSTTRFMQYGKVKTGIKTGSSSPGVVSAFIIRNEDPGDEIDFEIVGRDPSEAQTNFYYRTPPDMPADLIDYSNTGKEALGTNTVLDFHEYEIDWMPDYIAWKIDGRVIRTVFRNQTQDDVDAGLDPATGYIRKKFPSTPARIQFGIWDGGQGSNGTAAWAGSPTDWSKPDQIYSVQVDYVSIECYYGGNETQRWPPPGYGPSKIHNGPYITPGLDGKGVYGDGGSNYNEQGPGVHPYVPFYKNAKLMIPAACFLGLALVIVGTVEINLMLTNQQDAPEGPSVVPAMTFRAHHLKAQELKHTNSFSSLSSYASSVESDSEEYSSPPSSTPRLSESEGAVAKTKKSVSTPNKRKIELRPGGGTALRPAGKAHDWYSGGRITSHGRWFRDSQNRTLLVRGVNLCGNSKLPTTPNGSSHLSEGFFDHRNVCFLGRPFPRDQADEHFSRLKRWGLTFVRLLVPWEALEHSGPGIYDERFIDSLIELIELMPKYGIKCFIDPHQDCWSRFSGGSGAPGWTFEAAGLDLTKFKTTGAAYVHNTNQFPGDSPPMVWPTNYTKLAASTMFTLFWAGDTFAPNKMYQGEPIQQFLQNRYLECYHHLARRLCHLDAVIGFEVMNEPHPGYVGLDNLKRYDFNSNLFFGDCPSALDGFALGDGIPMPIEVWVKSWPLPTKKQRTRMVNTEKDCAWLEGECLWKQHGVWSVNPQTGQPQVDRPDYFSRHPQTGQEIDFSRFYLDFIGKYSRAVQSVIPSAFIFVEPIPNEPAPVWGPGDHEENIVYAPHWYDLHSLFNKAFDGRITHDVQGLSKGKNVFAATYFGIKGARKNYRGQLSNILNTGLQNVGNKPCFIGECGIPMDINQRRAFMNGDYGHHSRFLDAVLSSLEANLLSFALWNYNATNDNTHGDHWNGEDFSIFSLDSPQSTPELSQGRSPGSDPRSTLRQQAPSFAKEVMKRSAASNADFSAHMQIRRTGSNFTGNDGAQGKTNSQEDDGEERAWNDEDFIPEDSPFDRSYFRFEDEESDDSRHHVANIGGRALDAVVRPYAAKVAGEPISTEFHLETLQFTFRFCNYLQTPVPVVHVSSPRESRPRSDSPAMSSDSSESNGSTLNNLETGSSWYGHPPEGTVQAFETEIFVPSYHYEDTGLEILVSDGDWRYVKERQTLYYRHKQMKPGEVHSIQIKPVSMNGATASVGTGAFTPLSNKNDSTSSFALNKSPASPTSSYERSNMSKLKSEEAYRANGSARIRPESDASCVCTVM